MTMDITFARDQVDRRQLALALLKTAVDSDPDDSRVLVRGSNPGEMVVGLLSVGESLVRMLASQLDTSPDVVLEIVRFADREMLKNLEARS